MSSTENKPLFLGIGPSTQAITALLTDGGEIIAHVEVNYKKALGAKYSGLHEGGFATGPNGLVFTSPWMLLESLDLVLHKLLEKVGHEVMGQISRVAVAAQQHGMWMGNRNFKTCLTSMSPIGNSLGEHFASAFAGTHVTSWMCKAALPYCAKMHELIGANRLLTTTGSTAQPRFLVPQLMRIAKERAGDLASAETIGLINSLFTSVLAQTIAPIDFGDGLGTNGVDITKHPNYTWWQDGFEELHIQYVLPLLPPLVKSSHVVGNIGRYFTQYGFNPKCKVMVGTGDNCDSVTAAGVLEEGDASADLGSSFTCMKLTYAPQPDPSGCVFGAGSGGCVTLFMPPYASGLLQDDVCQTFFDGDYAAFDAAIRQIVVQSSPPELKYILAPTADGKGFDHHAIVDGADAERDVFDCVQAIFADLVRRMGDVEMERITVNGSAATSNACQILADMTGAEVTISKVEDGPALGAAIRAAQLSGGTWRGYVSALSPMGDTFSPRPAWVDYYHQYMAVFVDKAQPIV